MCNKWFKLLCKHSELQLLGTLNGGQSFRWKKVTKDSNVEWIGVFRKRVWILRQEPNCILYKVFESPALPKESLTENKYNEMLEDYFRLQLNLETHFTEWSKSDPYFKEASQQFYGIRILHQDVTENIFSFICSSNNNISRITSMVEKLAMFFGSEICEIDGEKYYSFPHVDALAADTVEDILRKNGFGYRAKYIAKSAELIVQNGGEKWLNDLKQKNYADAKKMLVTLTGIGAKVADCICLMSLGHLEAIPVDTHIYQIAARLYMPQLAKQKTVTEKIYNEIGEHFRALYGPLAGWAHTVLFCADLKKFQENNAATTRTKGNNRKKLKSK